MGIAQTKWKPRWAIVTAIDWKGWTMTDERRTQQRGRVLKSGKLISGNRSIVIDCAVRDLTSTGARVRVAEITKLPERLELLVQSSGLIYPAEVQWQAGAEFGLMFTGPGQRAPANRS
jgi:hypothetical protein